MKSEVKRDILLIAVLGSLSACQSGPLPLAPEVLGRSSQSRIAASDAGKAGQQVRLADLPNAVTDSSGVAESYEDKVQTRYDAYQNLYRGGNTPPVAVAADAQDEVISYRVPHVPPRITPAPAPRRRTLPTPAPASAAAGSSDSSQYADYSSNSGGTRVPARNRIIVLMPDSETEQSP